MKILKKYWERIVMLIFFFFHISFFGDSYRHYRYIFLFTKLLRPLQNTYFYVKSIVGFKKMPTILLQEKNGENFFTISLFSFI